MSPLPSKFLIWSHKPITSPRRSPPSAISTNFQTRPSPGACPDSGTRTIRATTYAFKIDGPSSHSGQEVGLGCAETRHRHYVRVSYRFIPKVLAPQVPEDRVSDKRSGNKYKFRAQPADISALQPKPPRKDTKS